MSRSKSRPVHVRNPWAIGGGGRLADLFPFSPSTVLFGRALKWLVLHPKTTILVTVFIVAYFNNAIGATVGLMAVVLMGVTIWLYWRDWNYHNRKSFAFMTKGIWRLFVLKRKWYIAASVANFNRTPKLKNMHSTPNGLQVDVLVGKAYHTTNDLISGSDEITAVLGANECKVEPITPGKARMHLVWGDPTSRVLFLDDIAQIGSDTEVAFALDPDGLPVTISLETSMLIVGESGSGKSNTLWSIIAGIIAKGIPFRLRVLDPAGGVELSRLRDDLSPLTLSYTASALDIDTTIRYAQHSMNKRFEDMSARGVREHTPTEDEPYEILLIDELLLAPNKEADSPLADIVSGGRKARHFVIALSQLSQVDAIGRVRDLFPQRICLATKSGDMTDAVLGPGAERDGARCSRISEATPGVGYLFSRDRRQYVRLRSPLVEDRDADRLAQGELPPVHHMASTRIIKPKKSNSRSLSMRKTALYRLYDKYGDLLYVGITVNPNTRLAEHAEEKVWWSEVDQSRTRIVWYRWRDRARREEETAIATENPRYNVVHASTVDSGAQ